MMGEFFKKNFVVLLAFLLPLVLIVVIALSVYLPSLKVSTDYDFVYVACFNGVGYYPHLCDKNYLKKRYAVVADKLVVDSDSNEEGDDRLFRHDTEKNESREITLVEAQRMTFNNLLTSPDGVTISSGYNRRDGVFFPFDGGFSSYDYYLTKGKSRKKIKLIGDDDQYYYQNNFQFIGWVLPGRN